jgi:crotonobetainyl-CoA hydratase
MSERKIVHTERRERVLTIRLDRPPVNAIDSATSRAMYAAFRELQDDDALSVGIVTGTGERIFCAGWDLKAVAAHGWDPDKDIDPAEGDGPGGFAGNTQFWDLYKPTIAAVNGAAIGGGFELALACDVMIMAESAYFSLPEMQRGFLADAGAVQRLPRRIPYNVAKELLLTGRRMYPDEAKHWGLVHKVVPVNALMDTAHELAAEIATGAPLALQALKEVLLHIEMMPLPEAMVFNRGSREHIPVYDRMLRSEDFMEGPRAFAEKRKPVWKGR